MMTLGEAWTRRKGWLVPVVPFVLSLGLSASTVSSQAFWQDSGGYLTAVKELGVLYPPGFVLYLLACKAWTALLFFIDFTLAVHLFSSFCAAAAAAILAVATRDFLRSRGTIFRVHQDDPGSLAEVAGVATGCLLAGGYTFWFTAIYAKGYALYYLILAAVLWRMIRADESRRPRDFTVVAALIGLAWQAHPSAALASVAFLLFAGHHARTIGWPGIGWRLLLAASTALGPTLLVLPLLVHRDPWLALGDPRTLLEVFWYASGRRFTAIPGVWGWEGSRGASFGQFLWEEFLGIGLLAVTIGLSTLARRSPRLLVGLAAWTVPYALVTILFKIEGQHDCWFVAAWLPLYLAAGVGFVAAARWVGRRGPILVGALSTLAVAWSAWANLLHLNQRGYDLPDIFGRLYLDNVDPGAILVIDGDDPYFLCAYQQRVQGRRADVVLVNQQMLFGAARETGRNWYDEKLLRQHPFLRKPDYWGLWRRFPSSAPDTAALAGFLHANAGGDRPLFFNVLLPDRLLPDGLGLAPAGVLWKLVPRTSAGRPDPRYWQFPILPEEVRKRYRRERAQHVDFVPEGVRVEPAGYEQRLLGVLLDARLGLIRLHVDGGDFTTALRLCESIVRLDAHYENSPDVVYFMALSCQGIGDEDRAAKLLLRADTLPQSPRRRASILYNLGEICRKRGEDTESEARFKAALDVPGLDADFRRKIEEALRRR